MGPIPCPETSVKDHHSTLHNISEERKSLESCYQLETISIIRVEYVYKYAE
jgi:hypothetical protein